MAGTRPPSPSPGPRDPGPREHAVSRPHELTRAPVRVAAIVYAEDPDLLDPIVARLDPLETEVVTTREAFVARLPSVGWGVVGIGTASRDVRAWVATACGGGSRLVVVSRLTPGNARRLGPLQSDGVRILWAEELGDTFLFPTTPGESDPLRAFAQRALRRPGMSPVVARAMRLICHSELPPHSVRALSDRLGVAPTTFRYHWHVAMGPGLGPKELIQWATLLRAVALRGRGKWVWVAHGLGVHRRTLERLAHRLTGRSLGRLAADPASAERLFQRRSDAAFRAS